ncbi:MAG: glycosyltransferase family 4 protein [Burkholderiales bacterium]|nr:glycosyltransferase family 4 protein [Burkholderiales bacterium]
MRLLYAFPEPLPLPRARGVQVAHTVAELARLGVEVELTHVPNAPLHPLAYYGVEVPDGLRLMPLSRSLPWPLARVHSNRLFLWRLERRIAAAPDALLFARHLKLAALLLRNRPGRKLVYEAHEVFSDTAPPSKRARQFEMESEVLRKATLVIANSLPTAERLRELYGERAIEVLPNGVDWPEQVPQKDWAQAGSHIAYAGSFFAWKGVADLVQAASELPGCTIALYGGDEAQLARERGRAPAAGARLEFRGHVPQQEVMRGLANACIAVLPNRDDPDSRYTSPIKLFEYMAAGCAIVASDLPPLRAVLAENEAVWVRPGDPHSLADGIRLLAADPERARRMGERGREKARAYTWRARAERLAGLLRSI